jgi:hypothetical protein
MIKSVMAFISWFCLSVALTACAGVLAGSTAAYAMAFVVPAVYWLRHQKPKRRTIRNQEIDSTKGTLEANSVYVDCIFNGTPQIPKTTYAAGCLVRNGSITGGMINCVAYGGDYGFLCESFGEA